MTKRVLLCADGQSLANPTLLGLDEERLDSISWLACVSSAESCRSSGLCLATTWTQSMLRLR